MPNFNLRKFLTENTLTNTSKYLAEANGIGKHDEEEAVYKVLNTAVDMLPNNVTRDMDVSGGMGGPTSHELVSSSGDYILNMSAEAKSKEVHVGIVGWDEGVIKGDSFKDPKRAARYFMDLYKKEWKNYKNK